MLSQFGVDSRIFLVLILTLLLNASLNLERASERAKKETLCIQNRQENRQIEHEFCMLLPSLLKCCYSFFIFKQMQNNTKFIQFTMTTATTTTFIYISFFWWWKLTQKVNTGGKIIWNDSIIIVYLTMPHSISIVTWWRNWWKKKKKKKNLIIPFESGGAICWSVYMLECDTSVSNVRLTKSQWDNFIERKRLCKRPRIMHIWNICWGRTVLGWCTSRNEEMPI